jgi:hypothetical protein
MPKGVLSILVYVILVETGSEVLKSLRKLLQAINNLTDMGPANSNPETDT